MCVGCDPSLSAGLLRLVKQPWMDKPSLACRNVSGAPQKRYRDLSTTNLLVCHQASMCIVMTWTLLHTMESYTTIDKLEIALNLPTKKGRYSMVNMHLCRSGRHAGYW